MLHFISIKPIWKLLTFIFLLIFPLFAFSGIDHKEYSVYFPDGFPQEVTTDMISLLEKATAAQWRVSKTKEISNGFVLHLQDNKNFKTKESFHLKSNGSNLLTLSASSTEGLVFGIYKHLRSLGFRFYLPDDLYTIVPSVKNPFGAKKEIVDHPFAQVRTFFGTGGLGTGKTDPDKSVEKSWQLWKLRNGFGSAYQLAGHRGENFILENKEKLQQHPTWLASPLYNNGKLNAGAKLNYLNKEAVEFYTDWSIRPFTRPNYKIPSRHVTDFVSLEPSDGGGYLNQLFPEKKLPSISDQVYGTANRAAEKLDRLFPNHPNIGVSLYAYSSHAEPPSFPLHPRVFVQLVPFQFQNVAFGHSFIQMWAKKAKRFGIYDYFRYPDAQYDLPGGLTLGELMQRLVFSMNAGSEGITLETSYSKFSTGIPLWIIGRYLADGDPDWQKNLQNLIVDLYKYAGAPVKDLFTLFYNSSQFNISSLSKAAQLTEAALRSTSDPKIQKRISEIQQYLYFVHLVLRSRDLTEGSLKERLLPVVEFAWKSYETKIIHSYRIMQLVSYSFLNTDKSSPDYKMYLQLHKDWFPETDKNAAAWSKLPQFDQEKDRATPASLLRSLNSKTSLTQSTVVEVSLPEIIDAIPENYIPKRSFSIGGSAGNRGYFSVYSRQPTQVQIKFKLTNPQDRPKVTLSGIDKNYTKPITYTVNQPEGEMKFTLPAGESTIFINASTNTRYRFQVKIDKGFIFFNGSPRTVMAFYKDFSDEKNTYDPDFYPSYVFFPPGADIIDYKVQLNNLQLFAPSGKRFESKLLQTLHGGFEIRQLTVPQKETGKFWKAVINGNYNFNFINIPDRYFLLEEKGTRK